MKTTTLRHRTVGLLCLAMPLLSHAHTEDAASGFFAGLVHPVNGLDHFLAMLSVGIVSTLLGRRNVYLVPLVFVAAMIAGGTGGAFGSAWPFAEQGIALSVVVLGVAIATVELSGHALPVMLVTAFFGALHGHAHGLEMPRAADPVFYAAGFVVSTASIHLLGVGVGHLLAHQTRLLVLLRHIGSAMAGAGIMILVRSAGTM